MLNRKKTISVLEACIVPDCEKCPLGAQYGNCNTEWVTVPLPYIKDALALIKEQAETIKHVLECAQTLSDALDEMEEDDG